MRDCSFFVFFFKKMENEKGYLNLMSKILNQGANKDDRTKTGVVSLFGEKLEFDILDDIIPILTTKKIFYDKVIHELLFFLSGKTDTSILENKNVNIWKGNTRKEFLEKQGLNFEEGDMGPSYPFQWRHCGAKYEGCDKDYTGQGVDQISEAIRLIKQDPTSRRIVVNTWNPQYINQMCIPPCHTQFQFYVQDGFLDCQMIQRSADLFLGVPWNIMSYALLTHMVAKVCDLKARKFYHIFGDVHIYSNHIEQCHLQLKREPFPFPKINIKRKPESIFDFKFEDFEIIDYNHHDFIKAEMAV